MPGKCKSIPQERISERMSEQSEVIKVTSSQDQIWQRTVEQDLDDTRHEPASRSFERSREKAGREKKDKILRFFQFLRKEAPKLFGACLLVQLVGLALVTVVFSS